MTGDPLEKWRGGIPAKIKAGGFKGAYWRLALRLKRLPTFQDELDAGLRNLLPGKMP